jgi:hypothetical protein
LSKAEWLARSIFHSEAAYAVPIRPENWFNLLDQKAAMKQEF